jgi:Mg2+-importing ATPase
MVASSNFGSVLSILIASAWLPFQPMTPLQILIQGLLYDVSQIAIPWDNMDEEYLATPQGWNLTDILRYIIIVGPTSSTIDVCIFALNIYYYGIHSGADVHAIELFQT